MPPETEAISWPVVFVDGLDVELYQSMDDISVSFEPWMARKQIGQVFDAEGQVLSLHALGGRVIVKTRAKPISDPAMLAAFLREHLEATVSSDVDLAAQTLPELIRLCITAGRVWHNL
jgi:hypothetical protein